MQVLDNLYELVRDPRRDHMMYDMTRRDNRVRIPRSPIRMMRRNRS